MRFEKLADNSQQMNRREAIGALFRLAAAGAAVSTGLGAERVEARNPNAEDDPEVQALIREAEKIVGPYYVRTLIRNHKKLAAYNARQAQDSKEEQSWIKRQVEKLESMVQKDQIQDFTFLSKRGREVTMTGEQIKAFFEEIFPPGFLRDQIITIQQLNEIKEMPEGYNIKGDARASCGCGRLESGGDADSDDPEGVHCQITFYAPSFSSTIEQMAKDWLHEIAHAYDPFDFRHPSMTLQRRLELFVDIAQRSQDPYISSSVYVKDIDNADEYEKAYYRARETWAFLWERILTGSGDDSKPSRPMTDHDTQLVAGFIQEFFDTSFDIKTTQRHIRNKIRMLEVKFSRQA